MWASAQSYYLKLVTRDCQSYILVTVSLKTLIDVMCRLYSGEGREGGFPGTVYDSDVEVAI